MADPAETPAAASTFASLHRVLFLVFLLCIGAVIILILGSPASQLLRPLLTLLVLAAVTTSLFSLNCSLPLQNVLAVAALIALASGVIEIINFKTHFPFGRRVWSTAFGPRFFHVLPWPVPFIWIVFILNSRGLARLLLRPLRNKRCYGIWSLIFTSLLAAILQIGFEHFAAVLQIWFRPDPGIALWLLWSSYALASAVILLLTIPWLINKKPDGKIPPDFHPVVVWVLVLLLLVLSR